MDSNSGSMTTMLCSIILFICIYDAEALPPLQLLNKLSRHHALSSSLRSLCLCWHCSLTLEHFFFTLTVISLLPANFSKLILNINSSSNYSCPMCFLIVCPLYFVLMISLSSCQIYEIAEVLSSLFMNNEPLL